MCLTKHAVLCSSSMLLLCAYSISSLHYLWFLKMRSGNIPLPHDTNAKDKTTSIYFNTYNMHQRCFLQISLCVNIYYIDVCRIHKMYIEMGSSRYLVMLKTPSSAIYYPNGCVKIVYFQKVIVDHKYLPERDSRCKHGT